MSDRTEDVVLNSANSNQSPSQQVHCLANQHGALTRLNGLKIKSLIQVLLRKEIKSEEVINMVERIETYSGGEYSRDLVNAVQEISPADVVTEAMLIDTTAEEQGVITQLHALSAGYTGRQMIRQSTLGSSVNFMHNFANYDIPLFKRHLSLYWLMRWFFCEMTARSSQFDGDLRFWSPKTAADWYLHFDPAAALPAFDPHGWPVIYANNIVEMELIGACIAQTGTQNNMDWNFIVVGMDDFIPAGQRNVLRQYGPGFNPWPGNTQEGWMSFAKQFSLLTEDEQLWFMTLGPMVTRLGDTGQQQAANYAYPTPVWPEYDAIEHLVAIAANPSPRFYETNQNFELRWRTNFYLWKALVINRLAGSQGFYTSVILPTFQVPCTINERYRPTAQGTAFHYPCVPTAALSLKLQDPEETQQRDLYFPLAYGRANALLEVVQEKQMSWIPHAAIVNSVGWYIPQANQIRVYNAQTYNTMFWSGFWLRDASGNDAVLNYVIQQDSDVMYASSGKYRWAIGGSTPQAIHTPNTLSNYVRPSMVGTGMQASFVEPTSFLL